MILITQETTAHTKNNDFTCLKIVAIIVVVLLLLL